jgi:hypothetical protein
MMIIKWINGEWRSIIILLPHGIIGNSAAQCAVGIVVCNYVSTPQFYTVRTKCTVVELDTRSIFINMDASIALRDE